MPATEETYRSQPTLHMVFAISLGRDAAVDRLDDHGRPPPPLEAGPARVPARSSATKLEAAEKEKLEEQKAKYQAQIDEIDAKIKQAEANAEQRSRRAPRRSTSELDTLGGAVRGARHRRSGSRRPSSTASAASTTA